MKYVILEHHPNDSRLKITPDGICQTLSQWMGTGGGNVPIVIEIHETKDTDDSERPRRRCNRVELRRNRTNATSADEAP